MVCALCMVMGRTSTIAAMTVAERMTAERYLAIAAEEEDLRRNQQLIAGEVVVSEPGPVHQRATRKLLVALSTWVDLGERRGEAFLPLDVKLDEENVYAPDILWYADGHGPAEDRPRPHPLPDLAVEVRSPSTWRYDVGVKKQVYETRGLAELWLADPAAGTVLVYRRSNPAAGTFDIALEPGPGELLSSPLLPGFELALDELFSR